MTEEFSVTVPVRRVVFTLTADQLAMVYRQAFQMQCGKATLRTALILIPIAIIFAVSMQQGFMNQVVLAALAWVAWTAILVVVMGIRFLLIKKAAQRIFAQQKLLQEESVLTWSETSYRAATEHSWVDMPWNYYAKVVDAKHVILLYQSDVLFNFIPKSVLTPEQSADIVHLAEAGRAVAQG